MDAYSSPRAQSDDVGFCAFFIRREAATGEALNLVEGTLAGKGFDPLLRVELDEALRGRLRRWLSSTALRVSPEEIALVIFAHDLLPIEPDEIQRGQFPSFDNARALLTMHALEAEFDRRNGSGSDLPAFPLQSSAQSWSLLTALAPGKLRSLRRQIAQRSADFTSGPVLRDLSRFSCRARVELIEHEGAKAVRKTFRPGSERFLERELEVFDELGPECDAIPRLLEHGPDYFVMEYVDDSEQLPMPGAPSLLPLAQMRQLADFLKTCVAHGFDPVDLKPWGNALYTRGGVKIIDYEFWLRCDPSTPPEESYCLAGLPADYEGDRPFGLPFTFNPYPLKWLRVTGLSRRSFLHDPAWLQRIKRLPYVVRAGALRLVRGTARGLRGRKGATRRPA